MTRTIWSGELDLTGPVLPPQLPPTANGGAFDAARILIRVAATPVGFVELDTDSGIISVGRVLQAAAAELTAKINEELLAHGTTEPWDGARTVSIGPTIGSYCGASSEHKISLVICTRNRADGLRRCIESIQRLRQRDFELLIVDNAPDDRLTEEMVRELATDDSRIRYVREARRGLSCARNRGLAEATGEYVAFTDDDVHVDRYWIDGLLRGFSRQENVACVTGLVASGSLEHPAEQYFDGRVSWASSCEHRLYQISSGGRSWAHPYTSGAFGTGANIAFRLSVLREIGGFDECLGAGSLTGGGEDLDVFVRILRAGFALSYEPSALVWHEHRVDERSLARQMHAYGKGLAAYLTKYLIHRQTRLDVARRLLFGLTHALILALRSARTRRSAGAGVDVLTAELLGLSAGPLAYMRARRAQTVDHLIRVAP